MSLWIVMGGQFGSEGKGKVSAHITRSEGVDICVRCGGPNSGHSFLRSDGSRLLLRQLPTGVVRAETRLLIPAGAVIDLGVLRKEMNDFDLGARRVGVDRNAMIIEARDLETERQLSLGERLSSTQTGVGAAVARRALRQQDVRLARDVAEPWLSALMTTVSDECNEALDNSKSVLVEGTQGYGLSLYHSDHYPKTTSRDTSAAGLLSEVGLSPLRVTEIVTVFRTFPIRVAGQQAGPLSDEIDWPTIQRESGYPFDIAEHTTVSNKIRRVARFDWLRAMKAVQDNRPSRIAIMGLDYLDYADFRRTSFETLGQKSRDFIDLFERHIGRVHYWGTGPAIDDIIPCARRSASRQTEVVA